MSELLTQQFKGPFGALTLLLFIALLLTLELRSFNRAPLSAAWRVGAWAAGLTLGLLLLAEFTTRLLAQ